MGKYDRFIETGRNAVRGGDETVGGAADAVKRAKLAGMTPEARAAFMRTDAARNANISRVDTNTFDGATTAVVRGERDLTILFKDGKIVKGSFTDEEVARIFKTPIDDIKKMTDDVDVKNAVSMRRGDLLKLGFAGSLTAGVVFLMFATGEPNPIEAIQKAIEAAANAAKDAGKDIFSGLFGFLQSFSGFSAVCVFIICLILIVYMLGSVVLKK